MRNRKAIIIGAGPAGLTAAYELLKRTDITPEVFEMADEIGGISKTVNYKGNRIDIGGHRFFSKCSAIVEWWLNILPLQGSMPLTDTELGFALPPDDYHEGPDAGQVDQVMLVRKRLSRILYSEKLFNYPISPSIDTIVKLGPAHTAKIIASYFKARAKPIRAEKSLEDFLINRFGEELYRTFFRSYSEKLWGLPCNQISAEWGAQRIKGLSIGKAIADAARSCIPRRNNRTGTNTETSLIRSFLYPKFGPGQLWTEVAGIVRERGGTIHCKHEVIGLLSDGGRIVSAVIRDGTTGEVTERKADFFFSTMPVRDLIAAMGPLPPENAREVANGLMYRDFVTVGVLLKRLRIAGRKEVPQTNGLIPDCWLYIQEPHVKVGRIQIFNNWSPYLVAQPGTIWLGLEYFCSQGDHFWNMSDTEIAQLAIQELIRLRFVVEADVLDSVAIRMPKAYPAYAESYGDFGIIRDYTDRHGNLFLIGRNGMHRYNNADHSMLTAMAAVDNIVRDVKSKDNIWAVNTEVEYHEITSVRNQPKTVFEDSSRST